MKGVFVTGTDTGIGKTIVSAMIMASVRRFMDSVYWKPVQTGIEEDDDTATVRNLAELRSDEVVDAGYRLKGPFSPHLSARMADVKISTEYLKDEFDKIDERRFAVVEGAGGVLVPLNESELMIDFIRGLNLPAIVVARSGLGTINHTCLTVEALRGRGVAVLGIVMNGEANLENRLAIEKYAGAEVFLEIPVFAEISQNFAPFSEANARVIYQRIIADQL